MNAVVFFGVMAICIAAWAGFVWATIRIMEHLQRRRAARNAAYAVRLRRQMTGWPR